MRLKLGGQLDYKVVQKILFRSYSTPNLDRVNTLKRLFRYDFISGNSSYSFHQNGLKLGGQLDHEMVLSILFRGYSKPKFDKNYHYF